MHTNLKQHASNYPPFIHSGWLQTQKTLFFPTINNTEKKIKCLKGEPWNWKYCRVQINQRRFLSQKTRKSPCSGSLAIAVNPEIHPFLNKNLGLLIRLAETPEMSSTPFPLQKSHLEEVLYPSNSRHKLHFEDVYFVGKGSFLLHCPEYKLEKRRTFKVYPALKRVGWH